MPLTQSARRIVERRLRHLGQVRDTVTIDADTHPTDPVVAQSVWGDRLNDPNYFHGKRSLFAAMGSGAAHTDPRLRDNPDLMNAEAARDFMGRNIADLLIATDRALLAVAA